MITFDLKCKNGHNFEGWFRNREDFDNQTENGAIACPLCGSTKVLKRLSPVAVHTGRRAERSVPEVREQIEKSGELLQTDASAREPHALPPVPSKMKNALKAEPFLRALGEFVHKNFEDVGKSFAEEARKIEYGEADARNIRGSVTPEEEKDLKEEGINFVKIPIVKYDA